MKRMVSVVVVIILIVLISAMHIKKAKTLSSEIAETSEKIYEAYYADDWDIIRDGMGEIEKIWDKNRFWASMTLSTKQIDEIDISLMQCKEYAKISAKAEFIGEFQMFCLLTEHITKQERVSVEELL